MIKIICVGKLKEAYWTNSCLEYTKRISKYHNLQIIELKDSDIVKEKEEILKYIDNRDYVISLNILGKQYNSVELSDRVDKLLMFNNITFIIGGSDGIHEDIKKISNELISFSNLTFPHQLFRVILLEQIYRSFKIKKNETYHK